MAMDHENTTDTETPRPRDPLLEYSLGCILVILMWLAVGWAVICIAPW